MKKTTLSIISRAFVLGLLATTAVAGSNLAQLAGLKSPKSDNQIKLSLSQRMSESRQSFLENKGQWPKAAKFGAQYPGFGLWLTDRGWKYDRFNSTKSTRKGNVVDVSFVGGRKNIRAVGSEQVGGRTDFLNGKKSVKGVHRYGEVTMENVYPGTDVRWYLQNGIPRYDFILAPGSDPSQIQMKFKGADDVVIDGYGNLIVKTDSGQVSHADLKAYQKIDGKLVPVDVAFKSTGEDKIGFLVGDYDRQRPLIIDPLVYGSYYGGDSGFDEVHGVAADADSGVFITGMTQAPDFPAVSGPYGFSLNGAMDAFVSKFQGDAYSHDYSAYIGGSGIEVGQYIALDPSGAFLWICGTTNSTDFPEVNGSSFQPALDGASDMFMMRFSRSDTEVLVPDYATYFGSNTGENLRGFAIAPVSGDLVVVGDTAGGLPSKSNSFLGGATDAFVTRFITDATGIAGIRHCFYVGGTGDDTASGVAIDNNDNVIMAGTIFSGAVVDTSLDPSPFMTTSGVFENGRLLRLTDVFIRKYDANGNIIYSALLGGNGNDTALTGGYSPPTGSPVMTGNGVAVDPQGNAYITGIARSFNFPRTRDVYGENFNANAVIFATKINQDGSQLGYSTSLLTTGSVIPSGIAVDTRGTAYIAGIVDFSLTFPVPAADPNQPNGQTLGTVGITGDALDPTNSSPTQPELATTEGFILGLTPTASNLLYGSYIGGDLNEQVFAPYVDRFGDVWVVGGVDVRRQYQRVSTTGAITTYTRTTTLPAALLSPFAFKSSTDPFGNTDVTTPYGIKESPFTAPAFITASIRRDGFLVKHRLTLPTITDITLDPDVIAGGLGASSNGTVTLSGPVPAGGLDITIELDNSAASFDAINAQNTLVINLAAGATTATFTIYSNAVASTTSVNVRATLEGNFQVALLTIQPWLQNLSVTPSTVVGGNQVTGRITIGQVAINDVTVILSTDASGLIEFPNGNTVVVPAGVDSVTFPVQTSGVGPQTDVPVTATLLGLGRTVLVRLLPANLGSITFNPSRVTAGASTIGTLTLDGEAGSTFTVDLTINAGTAGYVISPTTLTFEAGDRSKAFTVSTAFEAVNTSRVITATRSAQPPYSLQSVNGTLFVDAATLVSFTLAPSAIDPGGTATGTVTISNPAGTGGATVDVTSSDPIVTIDPVIIPAGSTSVTFPIVAQNIAIGSDIVATITAGRGPITIDRDLTIRASEATMSLSPSTVLGGSDSTATISLANPAGVGGLTFTVTSSDAAATVPASVTIVQGQSSVSFTVETQVVAASVDALITATSGTLVASNTLTINGSSIVSVRFNPSRVRGGSVTAMTVTLDSPAPVGGAVVTMTSSDPSLATIPATVTVLEGETSRTVTVPTRRVSRNLATQVSATYGDGTVYTILVVGR